MTSGQISKLTYRGHQVYVSNRLFEDFEFVSISQPEKLRCQLIWHQCFEKRPKNTWMCSLVGFGWLVLDPKRNEQSEAITLPTRAIFVKSSFL